MDERNNIVNKMLSDLENRFKDNLGNILKEADLEEFLNPKLKLNHKKYLLLMDFYLKQNRKNRFKPNRTFAFNDYCTPQQRIYGDQTHA